MSNQYLISGATGATGSKTVEFLLEAGVKVRAYVHRQDERSAALSALGAELVTGDLLGFEAVRRAAGTVANRLHLNCRKRDCARYLSSV